MPGAGLPPDSSTWIAGTWDALGLIRSRCRTGHEFQPVPPVLQVICLTVLASVRIYYQYRLVKSVTRELVVRDPYALKPIRKLIDACAFRTYRHWVKKGEAQNRAALFENTCKAILLTLAAEEGLF